jgi:hypothetical protein
MADRASIVSTEQVTLEVGELNARNLLSTGGAEVTSDNALQIVPTDLPSLSHDSATSALGLPLFLSNLQVNRPLALSHELQVSQDEVLRLGQLLSTKDSTISDLRASKKLVA